MIMVAQDQALRTNSKKRIIDKQNVPAKRTMSGDGDETISRSVGHVRNLLKSNIDVAATTR